MVDGHPVALRERVVAAYESGKGSYPQLGELFGAGEASVKRWVWLKRKLGSVEPKAAGGGRRSSITLQDIERGLATCADATALELTAELNRGRAKPLRVHVSSVLADEAEEALRTVLATERRLQAIDPTAMRDTDSYWSTIVEQMRHGTL